MADPDIRLGVGDNLICFSVSLVYFFVGEGPKFIAKLDGGMAGFDPAPGSATVHVIT